MIDFEAFLQTLPIMGKGLLGIFAVAVVIMCIMWILNRVTSGKSDE